MKNPHELVQNCGTIAQEEIIRTARHCMVLTGHSLPTPIIQSLVAKVDESLDSAHHELQLEKERDVVKGVIEHSLNQHSQGIKITEPIHHEVAQQAHQLEQEQLHQAAQRIHLQTRHIEQQRTIERQISHGIDFHDM
jgi:alpha-glucuronidase